LSELVCYIERAERGMLPVRLRLLSTRVDEPWAFPEVLADDRAALQRGLRDGADWLAGRLKAHGRAGLGAIVLDADGTRCAWVSTASHDSDAIGTQLRQAAEPVSDEDAAHAVGSTPQLALGPDARISGSTTYQPMGGGGIATARPGLLARPQAQGPPPRRRVGVAAIPDATIRLLLDELDARGVDVARIVTVWQAIAEAFDSPASHSADGLAASSGATTAQVCVQPGEGRLLWSWSRQGEPIAAGSFRLPRGYPTAEGPSGVALGTPALARLASEWIAWSTQLGASPARVRVLLPAAVWQDGSSLGERVAAIWPSATADIAFDDDPLGVVLSRFADGLADPRVPDAGRATIGALQSRPGRQHRSMYRWGAVAISLAAGVMGVAAFVVHSAAVGARDEAADDRREWRAVAAELMPSINEGPFGAVDARAVQDMQDQLDAIRRAVAPVAVTPEKPILRELETLALIVGNPDYTLEKIELSSIAVTIEIVVPDTAAYEELVASLEGIAGSSVRTWSKTPTARPNGIRASLVGQWDTGARAVPPGGA
jgi:hypothetical protein